MAKLLLCAFVAICLSLTACGTYVPKFDLADRLYTDEARFVQSVTTHIHCEMRNAVLETYDRVKAGGNDIEWLKTWSAKVSLTLLVDEKTGVNPDLTILNPTTFAMALNAGASSEASRQLQIDWFAVFAEYFSERAYQDVPCIQRDLYPIAGTLGLKEALFSGAYPASIANNISDPFKSGGRLQVIQQTVYFDITGGASATPTFRFTRVTANTSGRFFDVSRQRKDTLLVTMGPTQLKSADRALRKQIVAPVDAVSNSHLAQQFGIAVANSGVRIRP